MGRLVANAIIYFNSAILSRLLVEYEAIDHGRALALIKIISPMAPSFSEWPLHIPWRRKAYRLGRHCCRVDVGLTEFSRVWAYTPK